MNGADDGFGTRGLWSLWDMINFQVGGLCATLRQLEIEERDMSGRITVHGFMDQPPPAFGGGLRTLTAPAVFKQPLYITNDDKIRIEPWLKFLTGIATGLSLTATQHRIDLFAQRLVTIMLGTDYVGDVRALREAIEGEIKYIYFYHYPPDRVSPVLNFDQAWETVIKKFPNAKRDAFSAVDCFAMGQGTASVFHSMRVAEYGLRALARERSVVLPKKKPLEWAEWQAIIEGISKKTDLIANRKAGKARDAALEFYRGALGEFQAFKDVYRNNVMHSRRSYNDQEAQGVLVRVYDFMNRLAQKTGENPKAIRWGKMP